MTIVAQIALVDDGSCGNCGGCVAVCSPNVIYLSPKEIVIDKELCSGCGVCVTACPVGALRLADE